MNDCIYVGLDVHVQTVSLATARWGEEPVFGGTFLNKPVMILEHLEALGDPARLRVCYEAGPTGYGLARLLVARQIACIVVAPSLIPTTPGRQVKTDRIDAVKLARLLRSGDLTAVVIPTPELESVRAVSRAREAVRRDTHRAMMRLVTFLRQRAIGEPAGNRLTSHSIPGTGGIRQVAVVNSQQRAEVFYGRQSSFGFVIESAGGLAGRLRG